MADIKTKDALKGTIKQLDKAAMVGDRMRTAYIATKEKAEHSVDAAEHNPDEYASDRVENVVDRGTHEAAHQFDKAGRKGVETTKQNISKAKDGVQKFKERRAEQSLRQQTLGQARGLRNTLNRQLSSLPTQQANRQLRLRRKPQLKRRRSLLRLPRKLPRQPLKPLNKRQRLHREPHKRLSKQLKEQHRLPKQQQRQLPQV